MRVSFFYFVETGNCHLLTRRRSLVILSILSGYINIYQQLKNGTSERESEHQNVLWILISADCHAFYYGTAPMGRRGRRMVCCIIVMKWINFIYYRTGMVIYYCQ